MVNDTVNKYCLGCMKSTDKLFMFSINNNILQAVFQCSTINLCCICKAMIQHFQIFIQNVQHNQLFMENVNELSSELQSCSNQIQNIYNLKQTNLEPINIITNEDDTLEGSYKIISNNKNVTNVQIKKELKEEVDSESDQFLADFIIDIKEEVVPSLKNEGEICTDNGVQNSDLCNTNVNKNYKIKKKYKKKVSKKNIRSELPTIETVHVTTEEIENERMNRAQEDKFMKAEYKCRSCVYAFSSKETYDKHMEKHSESVGDFVCDICKQRAKTVKTFNDHKRNHTLRYKCSKCGFLRCSRTAVLEHFATQHDVVQRASCPYCPKIFRGKLRLRKHISYVHRGRERILCNICNKTYTSRSGLNAHIVARHPDKASPGQVQNAVPCSVCWKLFNSISQLRMHSIKHSDRKEHYCVECDKNFKSPYSLQYHLKTALAHMKQKEKPLSCGHCEMRFIVKRDLERHMNSVHLNVRPHSCDKCDKSYLNKWHLSQHKKITHEGLKRPLNFPCQMCDKVFDRKTILKGHIRTHTGERPYQCAKCPAQFSQASTLGTHVKLVHLKLTRDGKPKSTK